MQKTPIFYEQNLKKYPKYGSVCIVIIYNKNREYKSTRDPACLVGNTPL